MNKQGGVAGKISVRMDFTIAWKYEFMINSNCAMRYPIKVNKMPEWKMMKYSDL
jgi:hypothetical protein